MRSPLRVQRGGGAHGARLGLCPAPVAVAGGGGPGDVLHGGRGIPQAVGRGVPHLRPDPVPPVSHGAAGASDQGGSELAVPGILSFPALRVRQDIPDPDALEVAEPLPPFEPEGLPWGAGRGGPGRRPGARPAGYGKRSGVPRHHLRHALRRGDPPALPGDPRGAGRPSSGSA